ncbi:MAG: mobile mystery protein A [Reyranella sp.]|nr:mobile mystery protein A [Reyranella sp.]
MNDAIRHLDTRFSALDALRALQRPPKGWLRAIRNALGMTTSQYARRLGVSQPRVIALEKSEMTGNVTVHTLERAAEALGCRLVYVLLPERPLADVVQARADFLADEQVASVEHTMRLEDQAVTDGQAGAALRRQIVEELLRRPGRLWDGP